MKILFPLVILSGVIFFVFLSVISYCIGCNRGRCDALILQNEHVKACSLFQANRVPTVRTQPRFLLQIRLVLI